MGKNNDIIQNGNNGANGLNFGKLEQAPGNNVPTGESGDPVKPGGSGGSIPTPGSSGSGKG